MPFAAKKPCAGNCGRLVARGHCDACKAKGKGRDTRRPSAARRLYGRAWQKASKGWLRKHPLCADPRDQHGAVIVPATDVDHIIPHRGDATLFWDSERNWQGLCHACHSWKTANEDGGFGRS